MELEHELEKYIKEFLQESPQKTVNFLTNLWNSSSLYTNEKYEVILKYFINNDHCHTENVAKQMLKLNFPQNSVSKNTIKMILKHLQQKNALYSIETCMSIICNESYKEFFKSELTAYSKLISSRFDELQCDKYEILDDIIRELHYFSRAKNFSQAFRQHILVPLHKVSTCDKYERVCDLWNLIKTIYFSRSYNETNSLESVELFKDEDITFEQMEVLIESFIISFKADSSEIIKFLNHFNETVLSRYNDDNEIYLNHIEMLYKLLKRHDIDVAKLNKLESSFEKLSSEVLNRVSSSINDMKLSKYYQVLSTIILYDPFLFVDNNMIYKLLVECMMREKSESDMSDYETLLMTVVKIFGKDINQFMRKLLDAVDDKLENFVIPKKRKRKITNESEGNSNKKKQKLTDGSYVSIDDLHITNIWPNSIKLVIDDIFADLNVNQTVKLWRILNDFLRSIIENLQDSISENILFKIDFVSSLICQLITSNRIHEHLVYKSAEISAVIDDFTDVQHNFYETIIKIEYNNRIMNAFLKMSYDYENFIMMYFYHFDAEEKNGLDSIFIADNSKIKTGEWKIIQQRIKNFGKVEEISYSNLLMIQHFIKNKLFKIASNEDNREFLQNLLIDRDQINMLLERKDARLHIFNLLNDEMSLANLMNVLFSKIEDDKEKVFVVLNLVKNSSKILESLLNLLLKNRKTEEVIEIVKLLPVSFLSQENKKMIVEKLLLEMTEIEENYNELIIIFSKIFKNDGYKTFFKDFTISTLVKNLPDINKFKSIYDNIIRTSLKKMTVDVLKNLEWILKESNSIELIQVLAKCLTDINITSSNECSIEKVNQFKLDVIAYLSSKINEKNIAKDQNLFCAFSRLCCQNMQIMKDETKEHHLNLLNKLLKAMAKSAASDETMDVFLSALKNAKKLNLNDEIKGGIVKTLTKHMNNIVQETLLKEDEENGEKNIDRERELIATLSSFKSNCREECSQFLYTLINAKDTVTDKQLIYSFKIYELLFESCEKNDRKESTTLVKNYVRHCDNYVMVKGKITEVDLLCAVYSSHIAMFKCFKEKLDFFIIDQLFSFHIDQCSQLSFTSTPDFCKFYEIVGQFLFVLGNFQQNYFKSRIPQYFKAYNKFLDAIYYFKGEDKEEFNAKESSMLLRLTLQLENIMKMLMKLHSNSFAIISPYIVSTIVNVFIKTPKMLHVGGDKFKVNIKNICYQLLSTIDDKTRKHIYATVDESTRDVYEGLFRELKRK